MANSTSITPKKDGDPASTPPAAPQSGTSWTTRNLILFSFGFVPLLAAFLVNLWAKPEYQYFPLALAGAGFLIWSRIKEAARPLLPGQAWVTATLLILCFCFLATGAILWSPWLGTIAAFIGGFYLAWMAGGWNLLRAILPALLLAATIIPPPLGLDTEATLYLRGLAVAWSSSILDSLGVIHSLSGNIVELPQKKLMVEEACSGINSVLFVSAACLFYTFWRRRSFLRVVLTLVASLCFVLIGNVIRITLGAWLEYYHHINLLSGWRHELLGLVLLSAYLGLVLSFDELLNGLPRLTLRHQPSTTTKAAPAAKSGRLPRSSPRLGTLAVCLFALLGLAELGLGWRFYHRQKGAVSSFSTRLSENAVFTMPDQIGPWSRITAETAQSHFIQTQGISSKTWQYKSGPIEASVAFDYPFRGYHDVRMCYTASGWTVVNTDRIADPTGINPARIEVLMRKEPLSFGNLWFSTLEEQGITVEAPEFQRNLLDKLRTSGKPEPTTYRVQVLVTGYIPLATAERASVTHFFEEACKILSKQLVNQISRKP